jgi:hypothetical protein
MWMIEPGLLCRQHLLGEHNETHMLLGSLKMKKNISGYLKNGLLEPQNLDKRHNELVVEMKRRGYKHKSPLVVEIEVPVGYVNCSKSVSDLRERCTHCFKESV